MLTTDCKFLENELADVVRLFKYADIDCAHSLTYSDGMYVNRFLLDGEESVFADTCETGGEIEYKRYAKRFSKLALYKLLSAKSGVRMPWGALTGIRPTKLAYSELQAGRDWQALFRRMEVSEEKIALTAEILKAQEGIYERREGNCDLFVSVPFCPTKCVYCSFITADIRYTEKYLDEYIEKLLYELGHTKGMLGNLRSVYVGGGTPLVLSPAHLEAVLKGIGGVRGNGCEYTVEAGRPDVFTEEKLDLLQAYGVTRVCVNPQSLSDATLERIGRRHTAEDVYRAYEMARRYPFDINMDLIAGLTGESFEEFEGSLRGVIALRPENITVHCLCLKSGARLKEQCQSLDDGDVSRMVRRSGELLRAAGYVPYYMYRQKYQAGNQENTGWTLPGKACVYNVDIMEEVADNPSVGANAVSKRVHAAENRIERYGSPKDLRTYIEKIDTVLEKKRKLFAEDGM